MASIKPEDYLKNAVYFFDRPMKPIYTPKGPNKNVFIELHPSYFRDEKQKSISKFYEAEFYKKAQDQAQKERVPLSNFFYSANSTPVGPSEDEEVYKIIKVAPVDVDLDLEIPLKVDVKAHFSVFDDRHARSAAILIKYLTECSAKDFLGVCSKIHLAGVNMHLFHYALSVALIHRPDAKKIPVPSPAVYVPQYYFPAEVVKAASHELSLVKNAKDRQPIRIIRKTSSGLDVESRVAYFREDIGVNLHHWHWHTVYPGKADGPLGKKIVGKDRRGELFYYMHQQILARYNVERLCNALNRVVSLSYFRDPISEAYFPKLYSPFSVRNWSSRQTNAKLGDVVRKDNRVRLLDLEGWRDRVLDAIHRGYVLNEDNKQEPLTEEGGIDVLGNLVEPSNLSRNQKFYGELHNKGHIVIAYSHDPDYRYLEETGVMGDNKTAMRDPAFYRWHSFINDVFQEHKKMLPKYTTEQLTFKGVEITKLEVVTPKDENLKIDKDLTNELITFTQEDKVNLAYGLDVGKRLAVYVLFPHLQHKDFQYNIEVKNSGHSRKVTVRLFIGPETDETRNSKFELADQRNLFIELDKFVVTINEGVNTITHSSTKSSVTIPFAQMFLDIDQVWNDEQAGNDLAYCGCGWPHYMLIPKGTPSGFKCRLFAMLTDYEQDKVDDTPSSQCDKCPDAVSGMSYCGLKNRKYPDSRAMGYPFDRPTEEEFLEGFCKPMNMFIQEVTITHKDITVKGETVGKEASKAPINLLL